MALRRCALRIPSSLPSGVRTALRLCRHRRPRGAASAPHPVPETPEREEKGMGRGVGVLGAWAMSVSSVTAREGRQPDAERCLLLVRLQRMKWFWGRLKPVRVNPSLFPFPRFGAPLLGTGPKFTPRLGAVALNCARGAGGCPSSARGDRGKGREGALHFCLERKKRLSHLALHWRRRRIRAAPWAKEATERGVAAEPGCGRCGCALPRETLAARCQIPHVERCRALTDRQMESCPPVGTTPSWLLSYKER